MYILGFFLYHTLFSSLFSKFNYKLTLIISIAIGSELMFLMTFVEVWTTFIPLLFISGLVSGVYEHIGTKHLLDHLNSKNLNNFINFISLL